MSRWLALALGLALAAQPWMLHALGQPDDAYLVTEAAFSPRVEDDDARKVALPHRWAAACPQCRTAWYRVDLSLAQPPRQPQAIWLPRTVHNAAIYLNGRLLGQGGRFADPVARMGARPLWVDVPDHLWESGANRIYVLVKASRPAMGRLGGIAIGPAEQLASAHDLQDAVALLLPQALGVAAVLLALLMGWLARRGRPDRAAYLWLSALGLAVAAQTLAETWLEPWTAGPVWDALRLAIAAMVALAAAGLVQRLAPVGWSTLRGRRLAAAVFALVWLTASVATMADAAGSSVVALRAAATALLVPAGAWLASWGWRQRAAEMIVPGVVLTLLALAASWPTERGPAATTLVFWALLVWLLAAAWQLLMRFVQNLDAAELLNVDLEALVRQRTAELHTQFARVRELERRQAIADERERLMRDMHDGVGGHLVSMLAMIEGDRRSPAELAGFMREALDDMRLMIDSLEPVDDDLNAVLAMFRDRLAPRLQAAGVAFDWDVDLLPGVDGLTPARVLHVLRILQEAVTNALKHGRARRIAIAATAHGDEVRIEVEDDGTGFDPDAVRSGRGLKNLQRRATEVGAALSIDSHPGVGARVAIVLRTKAAGA